jgi:flavin-dependent dehydrogenase
VTDVDAIVVGGGPAGSVCAARLASLGRRVVLFERAKHPRFHLGESLLPQSLDVLDAIGVLEQMSSRFLVKRGARFVDGSDERRQVRYAFAEAFHARWDHAFEVPRDQFDDLLFRRAVACGADAREQWEVTRILNDGDRTTGVEARGPDGTHGSFVAPWIVDATGRDALVARGVGPVEPIPGLDRTALYTQVRGAWRDTGDREGDIQIVVFGEGEERGWFWLIPFADGRTSVGAVVSGAWIRARRALGGPRALFAAAVDAAPTVARMIDRAEVLFEPCATADFSFRIRTIRGRGWIAVGDAAGFIDPLFSTGAHLAMIGAFRAADAIDAAIEAGDFRPERLEEWERELRTGADLFIGAVQAFYEGDLVTYLFADPQHPFLRRAITSMLSGDVFDDEARWATEMRQRFPARG